MNLASDSVAPAGVDPILDALIERAAGAIEAGDPFSVDAIAGDDASRAERLRELMPTIALMDELGRAAREGPAGDGADPVLGDYRIIRELGRGGMGIVFEAEQASLGRRVAIKVLPTSSALDPRRRARFHMEAQAAAHLRHPHIVPIHVVGCEGGVHFLAMQFVDGPSLADVIRRRSTLGGLPDGVSSPRAAARLAMHVAEAMVHAHEQGILHRDLKPANLLLDAVRPPLGRRLRPGPIPGRGGADGDGRRGRYAQLSQPRAGGRRRRRGRPLRPLRDRRDPLRIADLAPPFAGPDRAAILRRIIEGEPTPPRRLAPAIPRDLETIVLKAMAKEPSARYASAAELAGDLGRFLDDLPIRARRPGLADRLARWARRHRAAAASTVFALAAGVATLGATNAMLLREAASREANLVRLRSEESRTRENLLLAARVLDDYGRSAVGEGLDRDPERAQRDGALLASTLDFCLELLGRNPSDPEARRSAARAYRRLANHLASDGKRKDAGAAYRSAGAILGPLAADSGDFRSRREEAALRLDQGANAYYSGHLREAEISYRLGLASWRRLSGERTADPEARLGLSRACVDVAGVLPADRLPHAAEKVRLLNEAREIRVGLGDASPKGRIALAEVDQRLFETLRALGRDAEAGEAYRRALATAEALEVEAADDPLKRLEAARLLSRLTWQLCRPADSRHLAEAERSYIRALDAYERLSVEFPSFPGFRDSLASANLSLVYFYLNTGRPREAEEAGARAVAIQERLLRDYPSVASYRRRLASSTSSLGGMLAASDHPRDALPVLARALEVNPASKIARRELAWTLASSQDKSLRDPGRAVALAEQLVAEQPESAADWTILGGARARAGDPSGAEAAIEKAMRLAGGDESDWLTMALILGLRGERDRARDWFDRAAKSTAEAVPADRRTVALWDEVRSLLDRPKTREEPIDR